MNGRDERWPALPLAEWKDTYATLHMWLQIVGKTRLALSPPENHWWHIALYLSPTGLTTAPVPYEGSSFVVEMDFVRHRLRIATSSGAVAGFDLVPMSVARFFSSYRSSLASLGIEHAIHASPVEVVTAIPFDRDQEHCSYDADAANRCWRILRSTDEVAKRYRGRFAGKQSPSHFFWGSFDLAVTRFSGRAAPPHPGGAPNCPDSVMVEAYSRECASAGFWPGGGALDAPAFYAYSYPQPDGYGKARVLPSSAYYDDNAGEFILPYDAVRGEDDPDALILSFFQTTYDAAAELADWDRPLLDRPA